MSQLSCRQLSLGYDGREILHDLSFEVNTGDYLCIVGENGFGKSTLMRTILGLQSPISGKILTGDGLAPNEIGYLPQQTVVQRDFPASVWEIVLSGCQSRCGLRPFYSKAKKQLTMFDHLVFVKNTGTAYIAAPVLVRHWRSSITTWSVSPFFFPNCSRMDLRTPTT